MKTPRQPPSGVGRDNARVAFTENGREGLKRILKLKSRGVVRKARDIAADIKHKVEKTAPFPANND